MSSHPLDFLNGRLNYERVGMPDQRELRLDRVARLLELIGNPHRRFHSIHIGGTKGKGSTAMLLADALRTMGWSVGLHTSPHLERIEERFWVNGELPTLEEFVSQLDAMRPQIDQVDAELEPSQPPLTYFEVTTAFAFLHFARRNVDWGIIEVGMGGRLDATNILHPDVAVITNIGWDHMAQLGPTLEDIAREKAGIIKPGRPVVSGVTQPGPREVIRRVAAELDAPLYQFGEKIHVEHRSLGLCGGETKIRTSVLTWPTVRHALLGRHQADNLALAAQTLALLSEQKYAISPRMIGSAWEHATLPGRMEVVQTKPLIVLDVAHNVPSTEAFVETLQGLQPSAGKRVLVFAATRDKDWRGMLRILCGHFDEMVATSYRENPRAAAAEELASVARDLGHSCQLVGDPLAAWRCALDLAGRRADATIAVMGSFFLVAELRSHILAWSSDPARVLPERPAV